MEEAARFLAPRRQCSGSTLKREAFAAIRGRHTKVTATWATLL
jgi:hypothetical protein